MKKVYLLLAFLPVIFTTRLNAQMVITDMNTHQVITGDTVTVTGQISDDPVEYPVWLINTAGSQKNIMCTRAYINQPAGMTCSFCWDVCYPSQVDTSMGPLALAAGDSTNLFRSDAHPNFNNGIMLVKYTFYEQGNSANNVVLYVKYLIGQVGIEEQASQYSISGAYPNPVKDVVNFDYQIQSGVNAALEIFDLSGKKVKSIQLSTDDTHLKADVSTLISGVYFYTFYLNGKAVLTKRLVVSK